MDSDQCSVWRYVFSLLDLKKDGLAFFQWIVNSVKCVFYDDSFLPFQGKQAMNPEHEATGAMKAAYQFNPQAKLQVTGNFSS